ncbi:hypothetical protein HDU98_008340 [Podochytrium sp. JEL0797]|nr:hypothetical protein HDU98_008340 [Podochytrium sp. JEL0797]
MHRKPPITASDPDNTLSFSYSGSPDGIDTHVLVLFHGVGDTHDNFLRFGQRMALPQTAVLSLGAPCPLLEGIPLSEGAAWFAAFDDQGFDVSPALDMARRGLEATAAKVAAFLANNVFTENRWGCDPTKVILFGFDQGAAAALRVALLLATNNQPIAGVVAVAGWLQDSVAEKLKTDVDILVVQGTGDKLIPVEEAKKREAWLKTRLVNPSKSLQVAWIEGKQHCLPGNNQAEMQIIMKFFSSHMALRNIQLESMSDVYEIK